MIKGIQIYTSVVKNRKNKNCLQKIISCAIIKNMKELFDRYDIKISGEQEKAFIKYADLLL